MKEIYSVTSQNGRWGLAVVSESIEKMDNPVQATATRLGDTEGQSVWRVEATDRPQWVMVGGDLEALAGARVLEGMSLQGNSDVTLMLLGPEAIVRRWGYKRRSSCVCFYSNGERQPIPASVLLALGLIPVSEAPEEAAPPPPFRVDGEHKSAIGQALIEAGYFNS